MHAWPPQSCAFKRTVPSADVGVGPADSSARRWAEEQFGGACLGDKRLTKRLVQLGAVCAERPTDSLPRANGAWASTKGTYRFIGNESVKKEAILQSVYQATARRLAGRATVLCVQDTTTLTFPTAYEAAADMGYVNDSKVMGMLMHSTLALSEEGLALGLLDVQMWARKNADLGTSKQRKKRPIQDKESVKWLRGIEGVEHVLSENLPEPKRPRCIHVLDREGDMHEVFEALIAGGHGAVIRLAQDRRLHAEADQAHRAHQRVREQKILGQCTINVRRRSDRPARQAIAAVRACPVRLRPNDPNNPRRRELGLWLIEIVELDPPAGQELLHWRLWTTEPAIGLDDALRVVRMYEKRWRIEDFHRTLKSGCGVEELRMHTAERIMKAIAIYAPVAVRIVELRDRARLRPEAPCTVALSPAEWQALWVAIHKAPLPAKIKPPTLRQAVLWIGRLGGHMGRKGDGMPGATTLWRGLRDLDMLAELYQSLHSSPLT